MRPFESQGAQIFLFLLIHVARQDEEIQNGAVKLLKNVSSPLSP